MRLDELAGNLPLKQSLVHPERLPHAMLLCGSPGSGRHTLARLLAQAMVCDHPEDAPCGVCPNCRRVAEGVHPDVPQLSSFVSSKDKDKKAIVVDTIRALRTDVFIRPNQASRKVYIIAPAEEMNPNAQNALLKVLEDGPSYASFLLIADNPMALLPTIRSRCVVYRLAPVQTGEALPVLQRRFPDKSREELMLAADQSRGIIGQAIALLDGDSKEDETVISSVNRCVDALQQRSELALMEWAVWVQTDKISREQLSRTYALLRDRALDALAGRQTGAALAQWDAPWLSRLADLTRTGVDAMERNVSPAHSAGWFAVSAVLWQ